jgi:CheY-like chemotaxis protein
VRLLEADGFAVVEAADGETALQAVHAGKPDLVLLDVMLPGIDGLEVTAEPGNSQPDHARGCASRGRALAVLGGRADCPSSIPASIADYSRRALVHLYMDVHNI